MVNIIYIYEKKTMDIHIGREIRKKVYEGPFIIGELALILEMHESSVSRMFSYPSVKTDFLQKMSGILKYDFFEIYSKELNFKKESEPVVVVSSDCERLLAEKTLENELLKKEVAYQKEIIAFMMRKK